MIIWTLQYVDIEIIQQYIMLIIITILVETQAETILKLAMILTL